VAWTRGSLEEPAGFLFRRLACDDVENQLLERVISNRDTRLACGWCTGPCCDWLSGRTAVRPDNRTYLHDLVTALGVMRVQQFMRLVGNTGRHR